MRVVSGPDDKKIKKRAALAPPFAQTPTLCWYAKQLMRSIQVRIPARAEPTLDPADYGSRQSSQNKTHAAAVYFILFSLGLFIERKSSHGQNKFISLRERFRTGVVPKDELLDSPLPPNECR